MGLAGSTAGTAYSPPMSLGLRLDPGVVGDGTEESRAGTRLFSQGSLCHRHRTELLLPRNLPGMEETLLRQFGKAEGCGQQREERRPLFCPSTASRAY